MMAPVPYTRAAVQLIRNGATAADLGWSASMYASVCKSHGIIRTPNHISAPFAKKPRDTITFDAKTGELNRNGIAVVMRRTQIGAFGAMLEAWKRDPELWVASSDLAEVMSGDRTQFHRAMDNITARLTPLRIWVESKPRVGYRLRVD